MKLFLKALGVISALQGLIIASLLFVIVIFSPYIPIKLNSTIEAGWTYTVFGVAMLTFGVLAIWVSEKLESHKDRK